MAKSTCFRADYFFYILSDVFLWKNYNSVKDIGVNRMTIVRCYTFLFKYFAISAAAVYTNLYSILQSQSVRK